MYDQSRLLLGAGNMNSVIRLPVWATRRKGLFKSGAYLMWYNVFPNTKLYVNMWPDTNCGICGAPNVLTSYQVTRPTLTSSNIKWLHSLWYMGSWMAVCSNHTWWRQGMETLSKLLALCEGNPPVLVDSPHKGPVTNVELLMLSVQSV